MNLKPHKPLIFLFITLFALLGINHSLQAQNEDHLKEDVLRNEAILHAIPLQEALGPIGPVAVSPFFGLTLTSGASIAAENGMFPENDYFKTNPLLSNWYVFGLLFILTFVTSFPNLFKGVKWLGLIIAWLEDHASVLVIIIIFGVMIYGEQTGGNALTEPQVQAGFFSFSYGFLLMALAAINMFVVTTVRYFFELLVFLSPVPFLDTVFEVGKKLTAAGLFGLYVISPWLAFAVNLVLFLIALAIFFKAKRTVRYFRYIYLHPKFSKLFKIKQELVHKHFPKEISKAHPQAAVGLPAFPLKKLGKLKKKHRSWLVMDSGEIWLYQTKWFSDPVRFRLNPENGDPLQLGDEFMYIKLFTVVPNQKRQPIQVVVNNEYMPYYEELAEMAGLQNAGPIGMKKAAQAAKEKSSSFFGRLFGKGKMQLSKEDLA